MHGEPGLILRRLWRIRVAVVVDSDQQPGGECAIDMLIKETVQMPSSPTETDDGEGDPRPANLLPVDLPIVFRYIDACVVHKFSFLILIVTRD